MTDNLSSKKKDSTFNFVGEAIPAGEDRAWFDRFNFEDPYSGSTTFYQSEWAIDRQHGVFCTFLNGPGNKIPENRPAYYVLGFKDGTKITLEVFDYYQIFRKESDLGMFTYYVERALVTDSMSYSDVELKEMIKTSWQKFRDYEMRGKDRTYHLVFADDYIKDYTNDGKATDVTFKPENTIVWTPDNFFEAYYQLINEFGGDGKETHTFLKKNENEINHHQSWQKYKRRVEGEGYRNMLAGKRQNLSWLSDPLIVSDFFMFGKQLSDDYHAGKSNRTLEQESYRWGMTHGRAIAQLPNIAMIYSKGQLIMTSFFTFFGLPASVLIDGLVVDSFLAGLVGGMLGRQIENSNADTSWSPLVEQFRLLEKEMTFFDQEIKSLSMKKEFGPPVTGFVTLALNADGIITTEDNHDDVSDFKSFIERCCFIWHHFDQNVLSSSNNLYTLSSLGIKKIYLTNFQAPELCRKQITASTNTTESCAEKAKTAGQIWLLKNDGVLEIQFPEISTVVSELANLQSRGRVNSLHQAITDDDTGTLKTLTQKFEKELDYTARLILFEELLHQWCGASELSANSLGICFDAKKLIVLSRCLGQNDLELSELNMTSKVVDALEKMYEHVITKLYAEMMLETHLKTLAWLYEYFGMALFVTYLADIWKRNENQTIAELQILLYLVDMEVLPYLDEQIAHINYHLDQVSESVKTKLDVVHLLNQLQNGKDKQERLSGRKTSGNFIGETIPVGEERDWFNQFNFKDPYSGTGELIRNKWAIDRKRGVFLTYLSGPGSKIPENRPAFYVLGFKDLTRIDLEIFDYEDIFQKQSDFGMYTYCVERAFVPTCITYTELELMEIIREAWGNYRAFSLKASFENFYLVFADEFMKKR